MTPNPEMRYLATPTPRSQRRSTSRSACSRWRRPSRHRRHNAGGIGGLLARSHGYSGGNWSTHNYYHADGNGNITYLENSSQALAASYRYDAFGNTLSSSGTLAAANVYRFSSKEIHVNTGLYYYGFRWYAPSEQRWLNRDPIQELGFEINRTIMSPRLSSWHSFQTIQPNLYGFVQNNPETFFDPVGLMGFSKSDCSALLLKAAALEAQAQAEPWNEAALQAQVDSLLMIYERFCNKQDPPSSPPPDPMPILLPPYRPPANQWNRCPINSPRMQLPGTQTPPPVIVGVVGITIIVLLPWPGNPIYGGA